MSGLGGILDVAIGMSFVYLLLSMVCSGLNELLAWAFGLRAKTLESGIGLLLHDPELEKLGQALYEHPFLKSLSARGKPSYLPSGTFALALLDTLSRSGVTPGTERRPIDTLAGVKTVLADLPAGSAVRRQLELFTDETVTTAAAYRRRVEGWFDESMERVSGVYKRRAQQISIGVGVALAIVTGVDSGLLVNGLMRDDALRKATAATAVEYVKVATAKQEAAVQQAAAAAKQDPLGAGAKTRDESSQAAERQATAQVSQALSSIKDLKLPIGIPYLLDHAKTSPNVVGYWLMRLLGVVFTGLAVALGSPFWFDLLSKLINLRISGDPPPTSKENAASP